MAIGHKYNHVQSLVNTLANDFPEALVAVVSFHNNACWERGRPDVPTVLEANGYELKPNPLQLLQRLNAFLDDPLQRQHLTDEDLQTLLGMVTYFSTLVSNERNARV